MRKKIMFFLFSLSGGGAERTIINLINNLNREKYEVVLVLGSNKNNDYIDLVNNRTDIKMLNCSKLRYCIVKLANLIRKENPDLLFSTINSNNLALLLAKIISFKKVPIIIREANNRTQSGTVTILNKVLTRILYNNIANKIVSLSKGVKRDLVDNFNIKKNKISVIYNPVEVDSIKKLAERSMKSKLMESETKEKVIISVGRLVEQKDFKTLLQAYSIVSKEVKSRLVILGKGPEEERLKELSKRLGISNKVSFLGFKKNPYKYIKKADLFVLSSKWEGFGHVIVESMVVGTPVISTNCKSGPKEIIGDDQYGLLVTVGVQKEMADKIITMLKSNEMSEKYKVQGRERAKKFDAVKIAKKYEGLFDQFL